MEGVVIDGRKYRMVGGSSDWWEGVVNYSREYWLMEVLVTDGRKQWLMGGSSDSWYVVVVTDGRENWQILLKSSYLFCIVNIL